MKKQEQPTSLESIQDILIDIVEQLPSQNDFIIEARKAAKECYIDPTEHNRQRVRYMYALYMSGNVAHNPTASVVAHLCASVAADDKRVAFVEAELAAWGYPEHRILKCIREDIKQLQDQ